MSNGFKIGINILLAVAIVAAVAGGLALALTGRDGSDAIVITLPDPTAVPSQPVAVSTAAAPMKVYVSGAVVHPGVYELAAGSRAEDALAAAGGATSEADLVRINLARRLSDEEQLHVPRKGEARRELTQPTGGGEPSPSSTVGKLNINTATAEDLQSLPGIGDAKAAAIVQYRQENGPFNRVDDLVEVRGIGDGILGSIRDLVDVR